MRIPKLFSRSFVLIISIALSGCAHYVWQKPGATQIDFNQDGYACMVEATQLFPVQTVSVQIPMGWSLPATTNCYGTSNGTGTLLGNSIYTNGTSGINCTTSGGTTPPSMAVPVDVNENHRLQAAQQCMFSKGWQRVRVNR